LVARCAQIDRDHAAGRADLAPRLARSTYWTLAVPGGMVASRNSLAPVSWTVVNPVCPSSLRLMLVNTSAPGAGWGAFQRSMIAPVDCSSKVMPVGAPGAGAGVGSAGAGICARA